MRTFETRVKRATKHTKNQARWLRWQTSTIVLQACSVARARCGCPTLPDPPAKRSSTTRAGMTRTKQAESQFGNARCMARPCGRTARPSLLKCLSRFRCSTSVRRPRFQSCICPPPFGSVASRHGCERKSETRSARVRCAGTNGQHDCRRQIESCLSLRLRRALRRLQATRRGCERKSETRSACVHCACTIGQHDGRRPIGIAVLASRVAYTLFPVGG